MERERRETVQPPQVRSLVPLVQEALVELRHLAMSGSPPPRFTTTSPRVQPCAAPGAFRENEIHQGQAPPGWSGDPLRRTRGPGRPPERLQRHTLERKEWWSRATIGVTQENRKCSLDGILQGAAERCRGKEIANVGAWEYDLPAEEITLRDQACLVPNNEMRPEGSHRISQLNLLQLALQYAGARRQAPPDCQKSTWNRRLKKLPPPFSPFLPAASSTFART